MSRVKFANASGRAVDAATRGLARAIARLFTRMGQREARKAIARLNSKGSRAMIRKSEGSDAKELEDLLRRYGLIQLKNAGRRAAAAAGESVWDIPPGIRQEFMDSLADRVVLIVDETRDQVQDSLRTLIRDAAKEEPQPTYAEIGRRIARQWHGPAEERESLFSFERAATIARTEMAGAENSGIAAGFAEQGVERVEWLANTDGKSGDRHHERMNGKSISVEAMNGSDASKWFRTPLGSRLPYPAWPGGPAKDVINCRCTLVPAE